MTLPAPLEWTIEVARLSRLFFSSHPDHHRACAQAIGKQLSDSQFVTFSMQDFLEFIKVRDLGDPYPHVRTVERILRTMEHEGMLLHMGNAPGPFGQTYINYQQSTAQMLTGDMWLTPILGPALAIRTLQPHVVHIHGVNAIGDGVGGTGLLIDGQHILTAAHVVLDVTVAPELVIGDETRAVLETITDEDRDVAVLKVEAGSNGSPPPSGLVFREPVWADRVQILGYPRIAHAADAYLTVQSGEVVNPAVRDYRGSNWFLFSAIARPGNSGGPIVARDGRLLGLVSRDFEYNHTSVDITLDHLPEDVVAVERVEDGVRARRSDGVEVPGDEIVLAAGHSSSDKSAVPHFVGAPTSEIAAALEDLGLAGVLPVEDWSTR